MATYTIYGVTTDGDVYADSSFSYATARAKYPATALTNGTSGTWMAVGQDYSVGIYYCYQGFIGFDTSSVSGTVSSVTLDMYVRNDVSTTDFTIEARAANWNGSVTTADYIVGADISSYALRASLATSGLSAGYNSFTSDSSFPAAIGGTIYLTLMSDRQRTNNAPTGAEYVNLHSGDMTPQATYAPRLTVTTLSPAATPSRRRPSGLYVR